MAENRKAFPDGCPTDTKYCIKLTESSPVYRTNTRFFVHVVENQQSDSRKNLLTEEDRNAILSLVKQRRYGKSVAPFVVGSPGNRLSKKRTANYIQTEYQNTYFPLPGGNEERSSRQPGQGGYENIFSRCPLGKSGFYPFPYGKSKI